MDAQFKVGDRVRVVEGTRLSNQLVDGDEHIIAEVEGGSVRLNGGDWWFGRRFEPVKAPVGQLARFNGESWDPIEESAGEATMGDSEWWDVRDVVEVKRQVGRQEYLTGRAGFTSLGLDMRVQVRRSRISS